MGFHQEHQRQETNPEGFILEIGNKVAKRQQQEPIKKPHYTKKSLSPHRNFIADSNSKLIPPNILDYHQLRQEINTAVPLKKTFLEETSKPQMCIMASRSKLMANPRFCSREDKIEEESDNIDSDNNLA